MDPDDSIDPPPKRPVGALLFLASMCALTAALAVWPELNRLAIAAAYLCAVLVIAAAVSWIGGRR